MAWLHCEITRFVDSTSDDIARREAEEFLIVVFKSLKIDYVTRLKSRLSAGDAIRTLSNDLLTLTRPVGIRDPMTYFMENDLTLEMCQGVNTIGINFKTEQDHDSRRCTFYYRPGSLPIIDFHVLYHSAFGPAEDWAQRLASEGPVHVVLTKTNWLRIHRYYCRGDYRFLLWKRESLKNPKMGKDAVQAGLVFRELCSGVWNKRRHDFVEMESPKLSQSSQTRLTMAFENALAEETGAGRLNELFKAMGAPELVGP